MESIKGVKISQHQESGNSFTILGALMGGDAGQREPKDMSHLSFGRFQASWASVQAPFYKRKVWGP